MNVHVEYFGILQDRTGTDRQTLDLPEGATLQELLNHLRQLHPALLGLLGDGSRLPRGVLVCVGGEQTHDPRQPLRPGDAVLLLPAVSGGGA